MNTKCNNLKLLYGLALFSNLIFYAPVSLLIRTRCGISFSQFFILQGILSISIFIFEIPSGYLCDRIGYRKTIILTSLFSFLAKVFLLISNNFLLFAMESLLEGLSAALMSGTISAYIYNISQETSAQTSAKYSNYANIGFIISTAGFPVINFLWKMDGLLIVSIVSSIAALIISFFLNDSFPKKRVQEKNAVDLNKLKLKSTDIIIILVTSIINVAFLLINFFYVTLIMNVGMNESCMSIIILLYTALQLSVPSIIRRFGEKNIYRKIQYLFIIAIFIIMSITIINNIWIIIPMLIFPTILSVIDIYIEKYQNVYIDKRGWQDKRASVLSKYSMISNFFEIIFLFFSSQISKVGVNALFGMLGFGFFVAVAVIAIIDRISISVLMKKGDGLSTK